MSGLQLSFVEYTAYHGYEMILFRSSMNPFNLWVYTMRNLRIVNSQVLVDS